MLSLLIAIVTNGYRSSTQTKNSSLTVPSPTVAALQTNYYSYPTPVSFRKGQIDVFGKTDAKSLWHSVVRNDSTATPSSFDIVENNIGRSNNLAGVSRGTDSLDLFAVESDI